MKIFDKRPLSLILCILLSGFVFTTISNTAMRITIVSISVILLAFSLLVPLKSFRGKWLTMICSVTVIIAALLSHLYFNLYFFIHNDYEGEVEIYGTVEEIEQSRGINYITLKTDSIDGDTRSGHKLRFYVAIDESTNISVGSYIRLKGKIIEFQNDTDFDAKAYYCARGYSAEVDEISEIEFLHQGEVGLGYKINNYRLSLCRRMILGSDAESGGLLSALLLGEREYLDAETRHDFTRTGVSHILALSGMHLAMLSFALEKLLSLFSINKKWRKLAEIIFTLLYMSLTGFPISVVRAGIMLIISSLLFLFARAADSITTLFISVTVICIIQPYAIFDISLWLSAFATLAILILSELTDTRREKRKKPTLLKRAMTTVVFSLLASLMSIGATVILTTASFGSVSLLAPVATTILSPVIQLYMYFGIFFLVVGNFISLENLIIGYGNFATKVIRSLSSITGIYLSAEFVIVNILVIAFTIVFFFFMVLDVKKKRSAVTLLCLFVMSIFLTSYASTLAHKKETIFEYSLSENDERIILQSNGNTAIIDMTYANSSTAYESISILNDMYLKEIDYYIFTDYTAGILNSARTVLSSTYVKNVYIPEALNSDEAAVADKISELFENSKSKLVFYPSDMFIYIEDFAIFPAYRSTNGEARVAFTVLYEEEFYTYLSSGMLEAATKNVALPLIEGCHTLILGRHGNSYSDYEFIYKSNVQRIVLSSKNMTMSNDTYEYYKDIEISVAPERLNLIR